MQFFNTKRRLLKFVELLATTLSNFFENFLVRLGREQQVCLIAEHNKGEGKKNMYNVVL